MSEVTTVVKRLWEAVLRVNVTEVQLPVSVIDVLRYRVLLPVRITEVLLFIVLPVNITEGRLRVTEVLMYRVLQVSITEVLLYRVRPNNLRSRNCMMFGGH